jgi:hypothetical protein
MKTTTAATPDDDEPRHDDPLQVVHCNGNGSQYGSRVLADEILDLCKKLVRVPEHNKQHIFAVGKSRGHDGEQDVRDISARQFQRENAEFEGQVRRVSDVMRLEVAGAERHCKEYSAKLGETPPTIVHRLDGEPWTLFSKIKVAILILLSVLGLAMGINTNAMVLMSTGIPAFENPWRAYCYSMVPVMLSFALKFFGTLFRSPAHRRNYTFAVCLTGIVLGVMWAASFAKTFPGFTQSAADIVQNLTANDSTHSNQQGTGWMVFISILAESFLAASAWLVVQIIVDGHQKTVVESNPAYEALQKEHDAWCRRRNENYRLAGQLAGKLTAISDARRHFVEEAMGHFHKALKLISDNDDLKF